MFSRQLSHSRVLLLRRSNFRQHAIPFVRSYVTNAPDTDTGTLTPVERIIRGSIKATGPLSFATYMQLCLSHPEYGYYMSSANSVFGSKGDFITSPEISQIFGELIGVWMLQQWITSGSPPSVRVVELGPGRGTLMDDILRVISQLTKGRLLDRQVFMVETSSTMRELQKAKLAPWQRQSEDGQSQGWDLNWVNSVSDISTDTSTSQQQPYTMVVAHEFFDALPTYIFKKLEDGWHEIRVTEQPERGNSGENDVDSTRSAIPTIIPNSSTLLPPLVPGIDKAVSLTAQYLTKVSPRIANSPEGTIAEISRDAWVQAEQLGNLLLSNKERNHTTHLGHLGGCALIIDYGRDGISADSLRAFKNHRQVSPFHRPGECDLTVNVDFAYLKEALNASAATSVPGSATPPTTPTVDAAATPRPQPDDTKHEKGGRPNQPHPSLSWLRTLGPMSQRDFLTNMGIHTRANALVQRAQLHQQQMKHSGAVGQNNDPYRILDAVDRLVDPQGMGSQYQVLGVVVPPSPSSSSLGTTGVWPFDKE